MSQRQYKIQKFQIQKDYYKLDFIYNNLDFEQIYNMRQSNSSKRFINQARFIITELNSGPMNRRSKSKQSNKQQVTQDKKSPTKKGLQELNDRQRLQEVKRVNSNILYSLTNVFLESQNNPSLIHPWCNVFRQLEERIIGSNVILIGPSQSGKYSAVRYALGNHHTDVRQILIDCSIEMTQYHFACKFIEQFRNKFSKIKWPKEDYKLISNENVDFNRFTPYFIGKDSYKFVIVIKNGDHLVGFKKQTLLYNLFQWMNSEEIQKRAGLVILSRQLMLIEKFEKRIRSRFEGHRFCLYRPEESDIFIKIVSKRIQGTIQDKRAFIRNIKYLKPQMQCQENIEQSLQNIQAQPKRRGRSKKTSNVKIQQQDSEQQIDINKLLEQNQDNEYINALNQYCEMLRENLGPMLIKEINLQSYFVQKLIQFHKYKKQKRQHELDLVSEKSQLKSHEQIQCLQKIKEAIEKNPELKNILQNKMKFQVITIPFVLRIFQHIFMTITQGMVKFLPLENLKILICQLVRRTIEFEFPINVIEKYSIENFNSVQLLLLVLIFKMTIQNKDKSRGSAVKLTLIYEQYRKNLHKEIHQSYDFSSNRFPIAIIERSFQRLLRAHFISYNTYNTWNSEINLLIDQKKIRQSLTLMVRSRHEKNIKISHLLLEQLSEIDIGNETSDAEDIKINLTMSK